jgi:hypothetical protein
MLTDIFTRITVLTKLEAGLFGPYLPRFKATNDVLAFLATR